MIKLTKDSVGKVYPTKSFGDMKIVFLHDGNFIAIDDKGNYVPYSVNGTPVYNVETSYNINMELIQKPRTLEEVAGDMAVYLNDNFDVLFDENTNFKDPASNRKELRKLLAEYKAIGGGVDVKTK